MSGLLGGRGIVDSEDGWAEGNGEVDGFDDNGGALAGGGLGEKRLGHWRIGKMRAQGRCSFYIYIYI